MELLDLGRHMSIFSRCLGKRDTPVLVARCGPVEEQPRRGRRRPGHVLMLTHRRMVITTESRVLRRLRLHLNCELRDLVDVTWTTEPARGGVRLAATAVDGVRERLWLDAGDADGVDRLDSALRSVFAPAV
jgi:hypothetical protein